MTKQSLQLGDVQHVAWLTVAHTHENISKAITQHPVISNGCSSSSENINSLNQSLKHRKPLVFLQEDQVSRPVADPLNTQQWVLADQSLNDVVVSLESHPQLGHHCSTHAHAVQSSSTSSCVKSAGKEKTL